MIHLLLLLFCGMLASILWWSSIYVLIIHRSCAQLLEQALVVEEQLHRAASLGLQHDPKLGIMQLHSRSVKVTVACH